MLPASAPMLLAALAGEAPRFFADVTVLLVAGAAITYVSFRMGLVPIVGFLLAGVIIGPNALGLVRDRALVDAAAEVGVILLLFTIGIEFSLARLGRIRRLIFLGGGLQVGLTCLVTVALLALLGANWRTGLYSGFLLSLSSTAIVLKLLADRAETNSEHGEAALGLLIFQDLAIVAMVLLVPMLAGEGGSAGAVGWALAKAGLLIAAALLVARRLLPPVLEAVARTCSPELFLLTVIAICFGTAWLTSLAGVSLSLGAFLAGLVVSESAFSEHALGEILPLQIIFSATFFVSVGMLLDVRFLVAHLPLVLAGVAVVFLIKVATTAVSVRVLGSSTAVAAATALGLAQVGEFSFVLERAGAEAGLFPAGLAQTGSQAFIAATVLLMVLTPALSTVGTRLATRLRRPPTDSRTLDDEPADAFDIENHVIVAGYGVAARSLVRALHGARIPFAITTLSPTGAREAEEQGLRVLRGDATRLRTLQLTGVEHAKMLVIADDDPITAERIAAVARTANPTMRIVVRTRYESEVRALAETGTDRVITEEMESIVQLFAEVLRTYEIPPAEIEAREEGIRRGDYRALRVEQDEVPVTACILDGDCLDHRIVTLRPGTAATGMSLAQLDLASRFEIRVDALRRDDTDIPIDPDVPLAPGDQLSLHGSPASFIAAAPLFRAGAALVDAAAPAVGAAIDDERRIHFTPAPPGCEHVSSIRSVLPGARGCEDCLRTGARWVHLRICMTCGHVGCCDSSPNRHATKHHHDTGHPVMRSMEPGEEWGWCYVDRIML
jgi:CPA2 family monovalent cation:H+ antiporter-2